jgi:hypothetical protein
MTTFFDQFNTRRLHRLAGWHNQISAGIIGISATYYSISNLIREMGKRERYEWLIPEQVILPPQTAWLTALQFELSEGVQHFEIQGATLLISGSKPMLTTFAQNCVFLADQALREQAVSHLHIEYYEGNQYITPHSVPLVLYALPQP